jgi:hypothetical protein
MADDDVCVRDVAIENMLLLEKTGRDGYGTVGKMNEWRKPVDHTCRAALE